ncbi:MAG TPA: ABC transporter substrate-binding protein [Anaerolineales bacterium]
MAVPVPRFEFKTLLHILTPRGVVFRVLRLFPGLLIFLAACAPRVPAGIPTIAPATPLAATGTPAVPHAAEIRFGLVGTVKGGNVWALFDSTGYSYNDYAIRAGYWPRLYDLSIPGRRFQPQAASGMPSAVEQEGGLFAGTVPVRSDLQWSDGSPFTAEDVAFTVNTALAFQLGFDWQSSYDPAWLDHAQAVDAHTVKFYFKRSPSVAMWQYGALEGPVVQKKYWAPKISAAASLLPTAGDLSQVESLHAQVADLQKRVNTLVAAGLTASGDQTRQLQIELQTQQGNLDGARNSLAKAEAVVDEAMQAAREALHALDGDNEPMLGTWIPAGNTNATWTNMANPLHPFGSPNFDRAAYVLYPEEASAVAALKNGQLNGILESGGLSPAQAAQQIPGTRVVSNQSTSARFIAISPALPALRDGLLRRALSCAIDRAALANAISLTPLDSPVIPGSDWFNNSSPSACEAGTGPGWMAAAALLKSGGYTWLTEPSGQTAGQGLTPPNGVALRSMSLLAPDQASDAPAATAAQQVQEAARHIGLPLTAELLSPSDIRFAVLHAGAYDMAIVGWRLSIYPGYLCDWFGDGNPFGFANPQIAADCAALDSTSDLQAAHEKVADILSVLAEDPAFIPLYSGRAYDVTRGLTYPFDQIPDGLSGLYGAPALAIPASP